MPEEAISPSLECESQCELHLARRQRLLEQPICDAFLRVMRGRGRTRARKPSRINPDPVDAGRERDCAEPAVRVGVDRARDVRLDVDDGDGRAGEHAAGFVPDDAVRRIGACQLRLRVCGCRHSHGESDEPSRTHMAWAGDTAALQDHLEDQQRHGPAEPARHAELPGVVPTPAPWKTLHSNRNVTKANVTT